VPDDTELPEENDRQWAVCVYCASGPRHPELLAVATGVGSAIAQAGKRIEQLAPELDKIIERRVGDHGVGFGAAIASRSEKDTGEWFEQVLPEDLIDYGLIPEFIGRLPVITAIHQLSRDDLTTILTEPKHALTRQFQRFFEFDDIELVFAPDSLEAIADKAIARETGARGLRSILEETLLDVQFELPSRVDVTKCVVTKETILQGRRPTLVTEAAQQDIGPAEERRLGEETA